jgi:Domain of unknown function (DUF5916)
MSSFITRLIIIACSFIVLPLFAQKDSKELHIKKTKTPIKLDGILDEAAWTEAQISGDFFLNQPFDTSYAKNQTSVKLTFDEQFIYVAVVAMQPRSEYTVSSFKRDFESGTSDVFSFNVDSFKDKLNGMQFSVSPFNVQREALISSGEEIDISWDNKWYSKVKNYDYKWVIEMAVPFKTLRYKVNSDANTWRVNFGRFFMKSNEVSTWSPVPRNFRPANLAFTGLLIWDDAPPKPGANISLIPYLSTTFSKDFPRNEKLEAGTSDGNNKIGAGIDAKIAVTPSLNLDLTVNPDFSQVEVDAQQTNLSRFELFFPEKRQFFIENSDLFGQFGFPDSRPFFSRRIGLTRNKFTGLVEQVPIIAGARLSGKLNDDWRIGLLNMQTAKVNLGDDKFLPATNYAVGVVQRKLFTRSYIGVVGVNKENVFGGLSEANTAGINKFNRMAGLEFNYYSPDNRLEIETSLHHSFSPKVSKDAKMINSYIGFHDRRISIDFGVTRIGENYNTEVGYTPRNGIYTVYRNWSLFFYPKNQKVASKVNIFGIAMDGNDIFDLKGSRLDTEAPISFFFNTPTGGEVAIGYYMAFTRLYFPFDVTNAADNPNPDFSKNVVPLPLGSYKSRTAFIELQSPKRYRFFGEMLMYGGPYFKNEKVEKPKTFVVEASLNYRIQPIGKVALDVNYTDITMPKPYNSVKYWLIGPKTELSFSKTVFFSTYFQYNSQINNTNINSRFQWRFKPVSDLFIVYTDNYFAENIPRYNVNAWAPKNRALILKMTYWLNL